jgi:hypothetical protein
VLPPEKGVYNALGAMFLGKRCYHQSKTPRHPRKDLSTRERISAPEQNTCWFSTIENIRLRCSKPRYPRRSSLRWYSHYLKVTVDLRHPKAKLSTSLSLSHTEATVGYMGQWYPYCMYIWLRPAIMPEVMKEEAHKGRGGQST